MSSATPRHSRQGLREASSWRASASVSPSGPALASSASLRKQRRSSSSGRADHWLVGGRASGGASGIVTGGRCWPAVAEAAAIAPERLDASVVWWRGRCCGEGRGTGVQGCPYCRTATPTLCSAEEAVWQQERQMCRRTAAGTEQSSMLLRWKVQTCVQDKVGHCPHTVQSTAGYQPTQGQPRVTAQAQACTPGGTPRPGHFCSRARGWRSLLEGLKAQGGSHGEPLAPHCLPHPTPTRPCAPPCGRRSGLHSHTLPPNANPFQSYPSQLNSPVCNLS